jgi:hypothetical protein
MMHRQKPIFNAVSASVIVLQRFLKPYRIIYRIIGEYVYVMLIADGRRDMQALLQRRLLQA